MIDLGYDQCTRCERRIWSHDPAYTEWEEIGGAAVCPACIAAGDWVSLEEVIIETRCIRCGSLVFVETLDGMADIPVVEEDQPVMCTSCSEPDGRVVGSSEGGERR